jgi:DNA-binding NarL/FixJ family response regulator
VPGRKAIRIELGDDERAELEARARRRKTSRGDAMRASIVLLAASGMANLAIARRLGTTRVTVAT